MRQNCRDIVTFSNPLVVQPSRDEVRETSRMLVAEEGKRRQSQKLIARL